MSSTRWLTAPQERAWRRYRRMRTLLDLWIARDLSNDSGLSDADYDVLSTLSENPGGQWRARDIAAQLLWSTSRLAHHVGRMEQRGLVARQPCADDARGAVISLTERGRDTLRQAAPQHVASVRRHMIDLLTADEVAALDTIAGKVISHLAGAVPTGLPPRGTSGREGPGTGDQGARQGGHGREPVPHGATMETKLRPFEPRHDTGSAL